MAFVNTRCSWSGGHGAGICSSLNRSKITAAPSQDGDRVDRRAGPAADLQRGDDEQELPAAPLGAGVGEEVEAEVVEQVDAHAHEGAHVDGDGPVAAGSGVDVGHAVAAEDG